jgi:hypothetical protein
MTETTILTASSPVSDWAFLGRASGSQRISATALLRRRVIALGPVCRTNIAEQIIDSGDDLALASNLPPPPGARR